MEGYSGQISRHEKHQQGDESTGSSVWHSSQKPSQDHIRSGSANMYRRTRKPNYSHEETIVLLEQIEIHRHILFGKATNHQRTELWNFIADAVNALPHSAGRTIEELKHRWKDISHRARLSARNIAQAKANNEQIAITPSMYFDIIMRILGEEVSEGSDFGMLSFNDSQNSSSRFIEDGHMSPGKFEVDIKPDINVINRYLGGDVTSHNLALNSAASCNIPAGNQSMRKSSNSSGQNVANSQNGVYQYSPASSSTPKFSGSSQRKYAVNHLHHNPDAEDDHSSFNSGQSSSGYNEHRPTPSGKFSPWRPQVQTSAIRPMRLDPVTQEVLEVDGHDLDSDKSENGSSCSKLVASDDRLDNRRDTTKKSFPAQPRSKKRKLDNANIPMQMLSTDDLTKMYLMKKIKMVGQRTHCFRLLEQKLKWEVTLLKRQASLGSVSSQRSNSSITKDTRKLKKCKYNEDKEDDEEVSDNLVKLESKQKDSEDEKIDENGVVGEVDKNNGENQSSLDSDDSSSCSDEDSHDDDETVFKQTGYDGVCEFVLGDLIEGSQAVKHV